MLQQALILHQYASSPFAEKVRVALGIKGLSWHAVELAPMPPRPLLDALTGGYRRIPVLQLGADIFCDTNIILPALERLVPHPSFYRDQGPGLAEALSFNFERNIWLAMIGVAVHFRDDPPETFLRDRKEDYLYVDMSKAAMEPQFGLNLQRVRAQLAWLEAALGDGRAFLLGDTPGALDLAYYHALWFIRGGKPKAEIDSMLGLHPILPWFERMAAIGHGTVTKMDADTALGVAKSVAPTPVTHITHADPDGLAPGATVTVTPDDFARVPVPGTLVATDAREVVLHHTSAETGDLHLHFPRAGFEVKAA